MYVGAAGPVLDSVYSSCEPSELRLPRGSEVAEAFLMVFYSGLRAFSASAEACAAVFSSSVAAFSASVNRVE
jgi:hypothetical protein